MLYMPWIVSGLVQSVVCLSPEAIFDWLQLPTTLKSIGSIDNEWKHYFSNVNVGSNIPFFKLTSYFWKSGSNMF